MPPAGRERTVLRRFRIWVAITAVAGLLTLAALQPYLITPGAVVLVAQVTKVLVVVLGLVLISHISDYER